MVNVDDDPDAGNGDTKPAGIRGDCLAWPLCVGWLVGDLDADVSVVVDNTDGCAVLFGTREVEGEDVAAADAADAAAPEEGVAEMTFELLSEEADVSSSSTDAETPRIFSWLSGRSPHVDRDCCASVYRQSALFRLQFEHGTPPSHFR